MAAAKTRRSSRFKLINDLLRCGQWYVVVKVVLVVVVVVVVVKVVKVVKVVVVVYS